MNENVVASFTYGRTHIGINLLLPPFILHYFTFPLNVLVKTNQNLKQNPFVTCITEVDVKAKV